MKILCSMFCLFFLSPSLLAGQTFGFALRTGLTFSQIDGDYSKGFNKVGFMGGMEGRANLRERMYISMGLQFLQKGSRRAVDDISIRNNFDLTINTVEVPLAIHLLSEKVVISKRAKYYKHDFYAGLSYGRLISTKLKNGFRTIDKVEPLLEKDETYGLIGYILRFSNHFGLSFEFRRGFSKLYDYKKWDAPPIVKNWRSRVLSVQGMYIF